MPNEEFAASKYALPAGSKLGKRLTYAAATHWLAICCAVIGSYVGLAVSPAVFLKLGFVRGAALIYRLYWPVCHQFAYRSWFLFGAQFNYAADEFMLVTGIDPYTAAGRLASKSFVGDAVLGYKLALCERDIAIYGGMLVASLAYAAWRSTGREVVPLHWLGYGLLGVVPIAFDGVSQLLSQPPFDLFGLALRESTPLLRSLTGALFGIASIWMAYPHLDVWMQVVREDLEELTGA